MALLLGMSVGLTGAQRVTPTPAFRVGVSIQSNDGITETVVQSYINRELRSLGDVEVVPYSGADWQIIVMTMKEETLGGVHQGYCMVLAYVRVYKIPDHMLDTMLKPSISSALRQMWFRPVSGLIMVKSLPGGTDHLRQMCESAVASFDTDALDPMRNVR